MDELNFSDKFLKTYRKGDVIFEEYAVGKHMCVINSGRVNIVKRIQGEDTVVATLGQVEIFGEMALVDNLPRSASAAAADFDRAISGSMNLMSDTRSLFQALNAQAEFRQIMKSVAAYSRRV